MDAAGDPRRGRHRARRGSGWRWRPVERPAASAAAALRVEVRASIGTVHQRCEQRAMEYIACAERANHIDGERWGSRQPGPVDACRFGADSTRVAPRHGDETGTVTRGRRHRRAAGRGRGTAPAASPRGCVELDHRQVEARCRVAVVDGAWRTDAGGPYRRDRRPAKVVHVGSIGPNDTGARHDGRWTDHRWCRSTRRCCDDRSPGRPGWHSSRIVPGPSARRTHPRPHGRVDPA